MLVGITHGIIVLLFLEVLIDTCFYIYNVFNDPERKKNDNVTYWEIISVLEHISLS